MSPGTVHLVGCDPTSWHKGINTIILNNDEPINVLAIKPPIPLSCLYEVPSNGRRSPCLSVTTGKSEKKTTNRKLQISISKVY